jgi:hypothetical protein
MQAVIACHGKHRYTAIAVTTLDYRNSLHHPARAIDPAPADQRD